MSIEVWAPDGVPEVRAGDDLAGLLLDVLGGGSDLADGDVVCVTSKVVSKAEGRTRRGGREEAIDEESVRLVARRGATRIVRHRLGLTMAAAGVVVTDTAGRAWREGQTDIAIGAAGLVVAQDFAGRTDPHGNPLVVTLPAVADELAGAAELAQGKLGARPVAVVRGRADLVLPPGDDGPGAAALVRPDGADMFGWGAREAVVRALTGAEADRAPFGAPAPADELASAIAGLPRPADRTAVTALCFAHGWRVEDWDRVCDGSPSTT